MIRIGVPVIAILIFSGCQREPKWPVEDQHEFLELCGQAMDGFYSNETNEEYCLCVLEHMMADYSDPDASEDIPDEKFDEYAQICLPDK